MAKDKSKGAEVESTETAEQQPPANLSRVIGGDLPVGTEVHLGNDLWLVRILYASLREQDVNAHVMPKPKFERLVENMRQRGVPESMPYCFQEKLADGRLGPIEIISGHHRVRAARAAGFLDGWILLDRSPLTRSQVVARQLAHNSLVGYDDNDLVRELLKQIASPEDLLATGVDQALLPSAEHEAVNLFMPRMDFAWKTVSFAFLPHQLENMEELLKALDGSQELVLVAPVECFEAFVKAAAAFARLKKILSGGTAVAILTELALKEVQANLPPPDAQPEAEAK